MFRAVCVFAALALFVTLGSSCKKTTEDQLINGLWRLEDVYLDTSTTNYLNKFPEFANGNNCCAYKMNFDESDVILAFYIANDTIKSLSYGTWNLVAYNQVYIKLDSFMDGTFNIAKPSLKHWELTTSTNHVKAFDGMVPPSPFDTCYTKVEMYKL